MLNRRIQSKTYVKMNKYQGKVYTNQTKRYTKIEVEEIYH